MLVHYLNNMWHEMWQKYVALDVLLDVANNSLYIRVLLLSKKLACVKSAFYEALTQHANHTSCFLENLRTECNLQI